MSQYYNSDAEAFYSINHIYYSNKMKGKKVLQHCFTGMVEIYHRINPTDPKTKRLSKEITCQFNDCYPAVNYDKEKAERAFEQALIRHCMKGAKLISDDEAAVIKSNWP